jgi:hypothetical protein
MRSIFDESLSTVERLMEEQITAARKTNTPIDKIVLVGGFGDSPALKEHLTASLAKINKLHETKMKMVCKLYDEYDR